MPAWRRKQPPSTRRGAPGRSSARALAHQRAFSQVFAALPEEIQRKAREAYARWHENPSHPALQYKKIHYSQPIYSVRVALGWRAIGVLQGDAMIWFWIGSHAEYDKLLRQLRRKA